MVQITKKELKRLEKRNVNNQFKEWSKVVKERDGNVCVICGGNERLNSHHIIPRENKDLRFIVENGITLCPSHHKYSLEISAHRNPLSFFIWFIKFIFQKHTHNIITAK